MPTQQVAGYRFFFAKHQAGHSKRPVLVLIHGAGSSHLDWPAVLRQMQHTTVLIPDLPGHGRSGGGLLSSIEAYAQVIEQWIDALSLENVVLLGHSMGGAIVLTLALRQRPAIRGIVLLASGARLRVSDIILSGINDDFQATVEWLLETSWGPGAPQELLALSRRRMMETGPQVMCADFQATDSFDVMHRLHEIQMPALCIAGEQDILTPPKYARFLAEQIPQGDLLLVPGAHHMVHLQRPDIIVHAVARFLDRVG